MSPISARRSSSARNPASVAPITKAGVCQPFSFSSGTQAESADWARGVLRACLLLRSGLSHPEEQVSAGGRVYNTIRISADDVEVQFAGALVRCAYGAWVEALRACDEDEGLVGL